MTSERNKFFAILVYVSDTEVERGMVEFKGEKGTISLLISNVST
jgi:hypothetical protein